MAPVTNMRYGHVHMHHAMKCEMSERTSKLSLQVIPDYFAATVLQRSSPNYPQVLTKFWSAFIPRCYLQPKNQEYWNPTFGWRLEISIPMWHLQHADWIEVQVFSSTTFSRRLEISSSKWLSTSSSSGWSSSYALAKVRNLYFMSVKIVFMVMRMKMPTRTMTNSNCTPPSGLRSYGKVVYVFGTLPIIGFVVFACKILALFPLVGSCLLMFVFALILPYLCICVRVCVFVYLGINAFVICKILALFPLVGSCLLMLVFAFMFHICVFVNLCACPPALLCWIHVVCWCDICANVDFVASVFLLLFISCIDHWFSFCDQVSFQSWLYNQDWSLFISNKNVIKATKSE